MNLADLKAKHPEIYAAAVNEGVAQASSSESITQARNEGMAAERGRIKAIDDMALPGMETLTNKAKYETGITAEMYAVEIIKAQKERGTNFLAAVQKDAKELDGVDASGSPQDDKGEEDSLLAHLDKEAQNIV